MDNCGLERKLFTGKDLRIFDRQHYSAVTGSLGPCLATAAAAFGGKADALRRAATNDAVDGATLDRIDDLVETFIRERVSQIRTATKVSNLLRRDVLPHWGTKSIHDIKKRDVVDLVSEVSQRAKYSGYRLLKTLKTFFRWCVGRAIIDISPAEGRTGAFSEPFRRRPAKRTSRTAKST
jgi:hypothetical protein